MLRANITWVLGVAGAVGTVGAAVATASQFEPWFYASHQYVKDAVHPTVIVALNNAIELIKLRQSQIKVRIDMAEARLRVAPNDAFAKDARDAAQREMDAAEYEKSEANCDLRQARGAECGR